ncbi:glucan endo-1,3-beta-D-glucosidase [Cellulomonas sp. JZ18]|uniref:glycoside hydrolase family 64 protein n=1 Tax=Cellulomonas sp. JZ18 TaxID=2654191 RepID=UPI0012D4A913|nr:beta-1,3-glucanase family protein [Cellulomonas sp. JZ18]QGQ17972.1 glucan endo-1,3-beta-D-glucosidase [Cellulomonas sp. JZ18]
MHQLRTWLTALVVGALCVMGAAAPAAAVGPDRLPITIGNQSGRGEQVFVHVLGTDLTTGRLGWVDAGGTFRPWPAGSNPPSPAPDSAIAGPGNGGSVTVQVPRGFSGRIYFAFGQRLPFSLTPDGLVQPAPWAAGDPTRDILFDWSELTYNDAGLWLNSSQVDMFAVPHSVSVTGASGQTRTTGRLVADGRQQVVDTLRADPAWARTVVTRADGTVLRVLAPGKAASAGLLSPTYLDAYIASAWSAYTTRTLTVQPFGDRPEVRYTGRTSGTTMRFTDASGREVAAFQRPSSSDVWGCDGALHAPNDQVVGPIARTLCAALFRGTLGTSSTEPVLDAAQFYRSTPPNLYGRAVHAAMVDGRAYAFAFDDVGAFESLVHDGDPRSARVDLTPFAGGGGTPGGGTGGSDGQALVSRWNGKCLDVPGGVFTAGARVQMWSCNGTEAQRWQQTGGALRTGGGQCLDVVWGGTANGTPVQVADCSGNAAQQWVLTAAGDLVNPQSGRCLDIADWNGADGARLQVWDCAGSANQRWTRR